MIAFCEVCGLGFHSLVGPGEAAVLDLVQRAHAHLIQSHPDVLPALSAAMLRLATVIVSRALDWGSDSEAREGVRAQFRNTFIMHLSWDGAEAVQRSP